jgi:hypothetical protein
MNPGCAILEPESEKYCAKRKENRAKRKETLRRQGDKPLKSLSAKLRDFAESFVFKGLIAFLFRRFPLRTLRVTTRRLNVSRLPAPAHHSRQF